MVAPHQMMHGRRTYTADERHGNEGQSNMRIQPHKTVITKVLSAGGSVDDRSSMVFQSLGIDARAGLGK